MIAGALGQLRRGRTCFAITHRLPMFEYADAVYRLDSGRIVPYAAALTLVARPGGHGA